MADAAVIVVTGGSSADMDRERDSSFTSTTLSSMTSRSAHTIVPADCPMENSSRVLRDVKSPGAK